MVASELCDEEMAHFYRTTGTTIASRKQPFAGDSPTQPRRPFADQAAPSDGAGRFPLPVAPAQNIGSQMDQLDTVARGLLVPVGRRVRLFDRT